MPSAKAIKRHLDEKPHLIAILILLLVTVWMASGVGASEQEAAAEKESTLAPKVKVALLTPTPLEKTLRFYGKSEPNKVAKVAAQVSGQLLSFAVKEGDFVTQGQVLAYLDKGVLEAQVASAKASISQAELEYAGLKKLSAKGLQDEVALARAKSQLMSAKSTHAQLQLMLTRSTVTAPFSGVVLGYHVEPGDYLGMGDVILHMADMNPLVVRADVTALEVAALNQGQSAKVNMQGQTFDANIAFVAPVADALTNTFKVEAHIANPDNRLRAGFSSELAVTLEKAPAVKISPAFLALDDLGNIGVKTLDENDRVNFTPVDVAHADDTGVYLWGISEGLRVITLGQGFVRTGDKVTPVLASTEEGK